MFACSESADSVKLREDLSVQELRIRGPSGLTHRLEVDQEEPAVCVVHKRCVDP